MDAERAQWAVFVASPAAERLRAAVQVMCRSTRVDRRAGDRVEWGDGDLDMFCHMRLSVTLSTHNG